MRAAPSSAILTASGGVVVEGGRDRWFRARDEATGDVLWQIRLDDTPNGFPISYAADGRQYVAVVTGGRSEEHTSELQSLMRISYAVFCLQTKIYINNE